MKPVPLEIGRLHAQLTAITGGEGSQVLPIPAWLIQHPEGLVLFDTGMHTDLQRGNARIGERAAALFRPDFGEGEELSTRLASRGVAPGDVSQVVISHLHFDHAGGMAEVPNARIVIQRDEWESAHDSANIEAGIYNPDDYDHGHQIQQVEGEHDVFGDGKVVCVPTPGHTTGPESSSTRSA